MKQFYLLAVLSLFLLAQEKSQDSGVSAAPANLRTGKTILPTIQRTLPRGSKTRDLQPLKLKVKNQPVTAHFYDIKPMVIKPTQDPYYGTQFCALDLWITNGKSAGTKRIISVPINYKRWHKATDRAIMDTLWLDPQHKKKPIIRVRLGYFDLRYKTPINGIDALVIFNKGLLQKPVVQQFEFGQYTGGHVDSRYHSFDTSDEKGSTIIKQTESSSAGVETIIWKWNGKQFEITEKSVKQWGDGI